jgi:hypothetical protein
MTGELPGSGNRPSLSDEEFALDDMGPLLRVACGGVIDRRRLTCVAIDTRRRLRRTVATQTPPALKGGRWRTDGRHPEVEAVKTRNS